MFVWCCRSDLKKIGVGNNEGEKEERTGKGWWGYLAYLWPQIEYELFSVALALPATRLFTLFIQMY